MPAVRRDPLRPPPAARRAPGLTRGPGRPTPMNAPALAPRREGPVSRPGDKSAAARERMSRDPREPLLLADWDDVLMIHYEVDPAELAPCVPFPLDLHEGRGFVSLVAFSMRGMRPARGGQPGAWLFRPIAAHGFLNVRTYVTVGGEPGIYFLTEHLDNRLSLRLGPPLFGLPYRFARIRYRHAWRTGHIEGRVTDPRDGAAFTYRALASADPADYRPAAAGTLTEWLMERYAAYTARGAKRRRFRVAHDPWSEAPAAVRIVEDSLLRERWPWFANARLVGANFSPGLRDVWMGRPGSI